MTADEFVTLLESVHDAIKTASTTALADMTAPPVIYNRFIFDPNGDIWSGELADDNGNVNALMIVPVGETSRRDRFGDSRAPAGTFFLVTKFEVYGWFKFRSGTAADNGQKTAREILARLLFEYETNTNFGVDDVLGNTGFEASLRTRILSDNKLAYTIFGTLEAVTKPIPNS